MLKSSNSILALDVGGRRIGLAAANAVARIAQPLTTLKNDESFVQNLQEYIHTKEAAMLVVGLPRGIEGQHTAQTTATQEFIDSLKEHISLPIYWQDETVTSRQAEAELKGRKATYQKGDIDALAAAYILEDFLNDHPEVRA